MWVTEKVSLAEFYRRGLSLASDAGYDMVLCLIAREADAAEAYSGIIKAWESIDDLTGPKILFLFAGPSAREKHKSDNILNRNSQHIIFSPDMLMVRSKGLHAEESSQINAGQSVMWHFDLDVLNEHTIDKHPATRSRHFKDDGLLARRLPSRPDYTELTSSQTVQIRELRNYLCLQEKDIPCLHFTFLDGSPAIYLPITQSTDVYTTLKAIVDMTEDGVLYRLSQEIELGLEKSAALRRELAELRKDRPQGQYDELMSALDDAAKCSSDPAGSIGNLRNALQRHLTVPSEDTRRVAFSAFNSAKEILSLRSDWKAVRSNTQSLIATASRKLVTALDRNTDREARGARKAGILQEIATTETELKRKQMDRESKRKSMMSPEGIKDRISQANGHLSDSHLQSFVVVAAMQELNAIRSFLDSLGAHRESCSISNNWPAERVSLGQGSPVEFTLILAPGQGVEDMADVLSAVQKTARPKTVLLVGMMAGIPGKSQLLDVQAPRNIINAIRQGTRNGLIVPEPRGRDLDPSLHQRLQTIDPGRRNIADIQLITHKHSICVAAKFDDLTPELAKAALAADPENVVGIEMEGAALAARQSTQSRDGESTGYLMIKGVADYAGSKAGPEEIKKLRDVLASFQEWNVDQLLEDPDPTTNKALKKALQKIATTRAMRVAIALLES